MKKLILLILILVSNLLPAAEFNHPGTGNFFEVGSVQNRSPYGYKVNTFYGVPRFTWDRLTLESTKLDYDLIKTDSINIGPMLSYNFTPYAGTEIDSISDMERSGFVDYGALVDISIPFGQLFIQYTKTSHENSGAIFKAAFASGIPLIAMNSNHMWLNILLEYTNYSSNTASYIFGVKESEVNTSRSQKSLDDLSSFTQIYGLWTPLTERVWLNFTYRFESFDDKILESPIVIRSYDQSALLGLMMTFN